MSSSTPLLARARALAATRSLAVGALTLLPAAAAHAQGTFTPDAAGAFYLTTSGIPTYAATTGGAIGGAPLAGGAMKLWGDTGVKTKADFAYSQWVYWSDLPQTFYRDGLTLAWSGTYDGSLVGSHYDATEAWVPGDIVALDYDFTVEFTSALSDLGWEIQFEFDGSRSVIASGTIDRSLGSATLRGTARGSNPLVWHDTPQTYEDAPWRVFLIVSPYAYAVDSLWTVDDSIRVTVPTNSIDVALNNPPSFVPGQSGAVPEPSTYAAGAGLLVFAAAAWRRRRQRQS